MTSCEARTQHRFAHCQRQATHDTWVMQRSPGRRVLLCTQHWHIVRQAEDQGGRAHAEELLRRWLTP